MTVISNINHCRHCVFRKNATQRALWKKSGFSPLLSDLQLNELLTGIYSICINEKVFSCSIYIITKSSFHINDWYSHGEYSPCSSARLSVVQSRWAPLGNLHKRINVSACVAVGRWLRTWISELVTHTYSSEMHYTIFGTSRVFRIVWKGKG